MVMWKKGLENLAEPYRTVVARLLDGLRAKFKEDLISLVVFGSVARGEARPGSDIDVLVVIRGLPKGRFKRLMAFYEVEEGLEPLLDELQEGYGMRPIVSPILKTPEEAERIVPLYLDMVEDAVIIHDEDGFFEAVLKRLKRRLEELGAKRVRLGKMWYWVLKPDAKFGEVIEIG